MAQALHALALLLRIKQRRIEQEEQAAASQAAQVALREGEHACAMSRQQACMAEQVRCLARIEALVTRAEGFLPADLVTLRHVLEDRMTETRRAAEASAKAAQALLAAQQALAEMRKGIARAQCQLEAIRERRRELFRSIEQAQEDHQDEETEEAMATRWVLRGEQPAPTPEIADDN